MPAQTLGDIVQEILSDMSSDQVDDITDTEEAMQVARIVRAEYYAMVDQYELPSKAALFQLDATSSATPTHMRMPTRNTYLEQLEYDARTDLTATLQYAIINYVSPEEFIRRANMLDETTSTVDTVTDISSGVTFNIRNDIAPTYYTSFDNAYIVMNSYDSNLESNLQQSRNRCWGTKDVELSLTNGATIDLDSQLFSQLVNRSRAICFARLKQTRDVTSERAARKLEVRAQRNKWRTAGDHDYPGYGR